MSVAALHFPAPTPTHIAALPVLGCLDGGGDSVVVGVEAGLALLLGVGVETGLVGPGVEVGDAVCAAVGSGVDVRLGVGDGVKVALGLRATSGVDVDPGVGAVSVNGLRIGREWPTSAAVPLKVPNDRTTATTAKPRRVDEAGRNSPLRSLRRRMRRPDRQKRRSPLNNPT
jgi:hypothetical protein